MVLALIALGIMDNIFVYNNLVQINGNLITIVY